MSYYQLTFRATVEVPDGAEAFVEAIKLASRLGVLLEHSDYAVLEASCVKGVAIRSSQLPAAARSRVGEGK